MKPGRRRCPVCWQTVLPTVWRNIAGHFDSIGRDICPGSAIEYSLTVGGRPVPGARGRLEFPSAVRMVSA